MTRRRVRLIVLGGLVLAFLLSLLTAVTQVGPGEVAVVRRFGRVLHEKPRPGLHIGLPWGIDRVDRVQVDLRRPVTVGYSPAAEEGEERGTATPAGQLLTGDHNLINVRMVVEYAVNADRDDEVVNFLMYGERRVDELVARTAEAALAEWAAGRTVDRVLSPASKQELPTWLVAETQRRLEPYRVGVVLSSASVLHLHPPREVRDAFDEVTRAKAEKEMLVNRARQERPRLLREAQSEADRLERSAGAYASEQVFKAVAEAQTFARQAEQYHELGKNDPLYLTRLWEDWRGALFGRMRDERRLDMLDHYLGKDMDITQVPAMPRKR